MAKIPVYQRQVFREKSNINIADTRANIAQGAYGMGIAQSLGQIGSSLAQFGEAMQRKQEQDDMSVIMGQLNKAELEFQDNLYSGQEQEYEQADGTITTMPKGLMNRKLAQANNSAIDYDNMSDIVRTKYSEPLNDRQKAAFNNLFIKKLYSANRESIIRHEAKQLNDYKDAQIGASIDLSTNNMVNNPSLENIDIQLKTNNGLVLERYKEYPEEFKLAKIQDNTNKSIGSVVESLLDTNNYELAENILSSYSGKLSGDKYSDLKEKTDKIKQDNMQIQYSNNLIDKFGKDTLKGREYILGDNSLSNVEKEQQLRNYNAQHNVWTSSLNDRENIIVQNLYSNAQNIYNTNGVKGVDKALRNVDLSPLYKDDRERAERVKDFIEKQIFGIGGGQSGTGGTNLEKTKAYFKIMNEIEVGKVKKVEDLIKDYGGMFTTSDYKAFYGHINAWNKDIVGVNFTKITNDKLSKNRFDVNEQIAYWQSVNDAMQLEKNKKGADLTTQEKVSISDDLLNKVLIQKRKVGDLPFVPAAIEDRLARDVKDYKYKLPYYAKFNEELNIWTIKDKNGDEYQITPEDLEK